VVAAFEQSSLFRLIQAIVHGEINRVSRILAADPGLASMPSPAGATRQSAAGFFFEEIQHYMMAGDTPLHIAAAAFQRPVAELLVQYGAVCQARNRRGAQPLHYASDANCWRPAAQRNVIEYLLSQGADPNALDKNGVSPLHRAVRTRSCDAVLALLAGGARVDVRNGSGSTPLHLAVRDTGRSGAGSSRARSEQAKTIAILLEAGARISDKDGTGKSVLEAAPNERIRALLEQAG
jgi:ankyrin repeat protein